MTATTRQQSHHDDDTIDSTDTSKCNVCGSTCRTRCSLCKSVYYCSVDCQRNDWTQGLHSKQCLGRKSKPSKRKLGPLPNKLRNLEDAQQALEELWSLTNAVPTEESCAIKQKNVKGAFTIQSKRLESSRNEIPTIPANPESSTSHLVTTLPPYSILRDDTTIVMDKAVHSYMVEDMPQISCYRLTLKRQRTTESRSLLLDIALERKNASNPSSLQVHSNYTLVVISTQTEATEKLLFVGEFPQPIEKDRIQWQVEEEELVDRDHNDDGSIFLLDVYHVSLPYPRDLANSTIILQSTAESSTGKFPTTSLQQINTAACATCNVPLFSNESTHSGKDPKQRRENTAVTTFPKVIEKVLPLPQGYWDDIAEYLICYSGQPAVDFTSSAAVVHPGLALEDVNLLCLHPSDVSKSVSLESMTDHATSNATKVGTDDQSYQKIEVVVDEEGEKKVADSNQDDATTRTFTDDPALLYSAEGRGDRSWLDCTGGGSVTLCCNNCSSNLGFVSGLTPETWRFWKHRLVSTSRNDPNEEGHHTQRMRSCASFLVGEMVRYAESKAIFTFVLGVEGDTRDRRCLLLQLLSWETSIASFHHNSDNRQPQQQPFGQRDSFLDYRLFFQKVAKVVFEESAYPPTVGGSEDYGSQWLWGGADLCCPPQKDIPSDLFLPSKTAKTSIRPWEQLPSDVVQKKKASTVRLDVSLEEYQQIWTELKDSRSMFSSSYEQATILMKMGQVRETRALAAIPL
ncbi:MYND finger domain containing protein [Nitzschia inconspicua]|uniref:MYND finger domain containing protein n=1 Tax=Nitzschia inconspicua TaxID=303405 RepID=A0A9K3KSW7_9STRA|nr:MYND finger domain containing protein [Nitzschia inconspicua]